jgi:SHS2 domain-containing protein
VGRHVFLEGVALADCAMEVEGDDLDDLFASAGRAVAEVMVDPATVDAAAERSVTLTAPSLDLLLYDWLSELIFLKDSEQMVFPGMVVHVEPGPPARLVAHLRGGRIDPPRTALRADAKAVTFHQFALAPRDGGWWARVVIDI